MLHNNMLSFSNCTHNVWSFPIDAPYIFFHKFQYSTPKTDREGWQNNALFDK